MNFYSILIILYLAFLHWLGDFVFQSDAMARSKAKHFDWLIAHTGTYSAVFFFGLIPVLGLNNAALFFGITWCVHTVTDFFTSRVNSDLWAKNKIHNFFVAVGFDQFMHSVQLILTFYFLQN